VKALERMSVPYSIVIEPQEYDAYAAVIVPSKILTLPFSNLEQGSIPARGYHVRSDLKAARTSPRSWETEAGEVSGAGP
jgi:hypothetical protein